MVRLILEPAIARLAAENISDDGLRMLKAHLDCMDERIGDKEGFIECDMEFHSVLARQSGNRILAVLSSILSDLSRMVQWAYRDRVEDRRRSVMFHKTIFEAVKSGDSEAADEAMAEHIQDVWGRIEQV